MSEGSDDMVTIPEDKVTIKDLSEWAALQIEVKKLAAKEVMIRRRIFKALFRTPTEGTNTFDLTPLWEEANQPADGYVLKAKYDIRREIDTGSLDALKAKLAAQKEAIASGAVIAPEQLINFSLDQLVEYKPSLRKKFYNELTETQKHLFDQCVIVKPTETPALEIVLPAKKGKVGEHASDTPS